MRACLRLWAQASFFKSEKGIKGYDTANVVHHNLDRGLVGWPQLSPNPLLQTHLKARQPRAFLLA
jgi:hypothetical protein